MCEYIVAALSAAVSAAKIPRRLCLLLTYLVYPEDGGSTFLHILLFLLIRLVGSGIQLGPLGTAATDWPIVACPR
jgi:hypothetical protein